MEQNAPPHPDAPMAVAAASKSAEVAHAVAAAAPASTKRILLKDCAEPPLPDIVLPGLRVGSVGIVAGWGDINMSALALQIGIGVVLGKPVTRAPEGGPTLAPKPGAVVVALGTDPPGEVRRQMAHLRASLGPSEVARADADDGLYVYSTCGEDMRVACQSGNQMVPGPWRARLRELATGRRLVIIDQLVFLHDGAMGEGASTWHVMRQLARIAVATHSAILILQHVPQQTDDISGGWGTEPHAPDPGASPLMPYTLRAPTAADVEHLGIGRHARDCWLCVAEPAGERGGSGGPTRHLLGSGNT